MLRIPRKHGHFIFSVVQAALTTAIAAGIASISFFGSFAFVENWLRSWLVAWMTTIPVVLLAAPAIQRLVLALTVERRDRIDK
jgi:ABC-type multidrug transport system permease subunit